MRDTLDILLCVNDGYAQHAGVCIYSIWKNNPNLSVVITIAATELNKTTLDKFEQLSIQLGIVINVKHFDKDKLELFPQIGNYSKDVYVRLWVEEFYETIPERVLYLDADTICVNELSELVFLNLEDKLFGAVAIPGATAQERCVMPLDKPYVNSGVILFNLKEWDGPVVRNEIAQYLNTYNKTALNPDQDALNSLFFEKTKLLDLKFNCISTVFREKEITINLNKNEIASLYESITVVHFNGQSRPWSYTCCHPYAVHYVQYLNETPWRDFVFKDRSLLNIVKKTIRLILNLDNYSVLKKLNGDLEKS